MSKKEDKKEFLEAWLQLTGLFFWIGFVAFVGWSFLEKVLVWLVG